jgi:hypothetical protein
VLAWLEGPLNALFRNAVYGVAVEQLLDCAVLCCGVVWCGATGNPQPAYKLEGMKILMEFPKPKDEEQAANAMPEVERKQVRCSRGQVQGTVDGRGQAGAQGMVGAGANLQRQGDADNYEAQL